MVDRNKESGVIQVFVPELPNTPGWVALPEKKRDALLQITSDVRQFDGMVNLGEFGRLMRLTEAKQILDGEEMSFWDYLCQLYPDDHRRTLFRKQAMFEEFAGTMPPGVVKRLASVSTDVMGKFDRIAKAALGDIRNAIKAMPALPVKTTEDAEQYLEKLDEKLLEHRQARRKGKKLKRDEGLAAKMATNAVIHYIREGGLETSAQKRSWLMRVIGWVMEAQAISGALKSIHRQPIPDGIIIRRGRPIGSKTRRKEAT